MDGLSRHSSSLLCRSRYGSRPGCSLHGCLAPVYEHHGVGGCSIGSDGRGFWTGVGVHWEAVRLD